MQAWKVRWSLAVLACVVACDGGSGDGAETDTDGFTSSTGGGVTTSMTSAQPEPPETTSASSASAGTTAASTNTGGETTDDASTSSAGEESSTGEPPMGSAGCGSALEPGFSCFDVEFEGATRQWCLNVPESYDPEHVYELVIGLHGCGGNNAAVHGHRAPMEADGEQEFLFVYPQAAGSCWELSDVAFVDHMISSAQDTACLEPGRTFVHGMSSGGGMAGTVADAGLAIGFASVAGGGGADTPTPAYFYSGTTDGYYLTLVAAFEYQLSINGCSKTNIPIDGTPCVRYEDCQAPVTYCEDDRGHVWPMEDWAQGGILDVFRAVP